MITRSLVVAFICGLSLVAIGCESEKGHTLATCNSEKAAFAAQEAQIKAQAEDNRRICELQVSIAKSCADRGDIPVFINGNVDCKPGRK